MFGTEKLHEKKKVNHSAAFYVIGIFILAVEILFGLNAAFLIDQNMLIVADSMLSNTPLSWLAALLALFVSLALGFGFLLGGMWTFGGFMDNLDNAKAYEEEYGTRRWPRGLLWALLLLMMVLDFTTLCFRISYFAEKGMWAWFAFFCGVILAAPLLGAIIHVLEHTPRGRRLSVAYQQASVYEANDLADAIKSMDPDLRSRLLNGDQAALTEHYDRVDATREANYELEQARMREREAKQQRKHSPPTMTTSPLARASLAKTDRANQRSK